MDNLERYCRAVDRLNRAKRRAQFREELADGLRVVAAAKAAGLSIKAATIAGVSLESARLLSGRSARKTRGASKCFG